jgi:hypothetical protein
LEDTDIKEQFLKRLTSLIENLANGNAAEFARQAKMPPTTLSNYYKKKKGKGKNRLPRAEQLILICEHTGCSLNWLLLGKGPPFLETEKKLPSDNEFSFTARYSVKTEALLEKAGEILESEYQDFVDALTIDIEESHRRIQTLKKKKSE